MYPVIPWLLNARMGEYVSAMTWYIYRYTELNFNSRSKVPAHRYFGHQKINLTHVSTFFENYSCITVVEANSTHSVAFVLVKPYNRSDEKHLANIEALAELMIQHEFTKITFSTTTLPLDVSL